MKVSESEKYWRGELENCELNSFSYYIRKIMKNLFIYHIMQFFNFKIFLKQLPYILISLDLLHMSFHNLQWFSFSALPVPQVIGQVTGQRLLSYYHRTYSHKSMPCPGIVYVLQVCMEVRLSCGSKRCDNHEALFPV